MNLIIFFNLITLPPDNAISIAVNHQYTIPTLPLVSYVYERTSFDILSMKL